MQTLANNSERPTPRLATTTERLWHWQPGLWRLALPQATRLIAGVTDRSADLARLQATFPHAQGFIQAAQVHGASVAALETPAPATNPIPGCDGFLTQLPNLVLVIRSADCLPLAFWDPVQQVVGLAHVGWRGLAQSLPSRLMMAAQQIYRSRPRDCWVAIGPAIRACCYDVSNDFPQDARPFLQRDAGRLTCDLIGWAIHQLRMAGVPSPHVLDCGQCTACQPSRWYSMRREGKAAGRLLSFIMVRPSRGER